MYRIEIRLDYNDKIFISKPSEIEKSELDKLTKQVQEIVKTKAEYLTLEDYQGTHFFGAEILSKSIISLLIKEIV